MGDRHLFFYKLIYLYCVLCISMALDDPDRGKNNYRFISYYNLVEMLALMNFSESIQANLGSVSHDLAIS